MEPRVHFDFYEGENKTVVFINDFPLSASSTSRTAEKLARSLRLRYYTGKLYPEDGGRPIKQFFPLDYPGEEGFNEWK
jgi:hypothetical protein